MEIEVFTDGSATTNDKPGGWGYVVVIDGTKYSEGNGGMANATNNDAEMQAAIEGLKFLLKEFDDGRLSILKITDSNISLVSDSQLILGWASGTYRFKQEDKIEKYNELRYLVERMYVKTKWVEGHSGNEFNERCDKLANEARRLIVDGAKRTERKARGETLIGTKKNGTMCVWYKDTLKIIDLESNVLEDYNREVHGNRGSLLEVREEKTR